MNKILFYLFNKGYFPIDHNKVKNEKTLKGIYLDPKHDEFKKALLNDVCKWMAEELEIKGNISAQYEVYQRLIYTFTPEKEFKDTGYIDPLKKIKEEIENSLAKGK